MNKNKILSISMKGEDALRWNLIMERIRSRERGKVFEADVFRELVGLAPPSLVTETERLILAHGTEYPRARPDQVPGGRRKRDVG